MNARHIMRERQHENKETKFGYFDNSLVVSWNGSWIWHQISYRTNFWPGKSAFVENGKVDFDIYDIFIQTFGLF